MGVSIPLPRRCERRALPIAPIPQKHVHPSGLEPDSSAWKAEILPLYYGCNIIASRNYDYNLHCYFYKDV